MIFVRAIRSEQPEIIISSLSPMPKSITVLIRIVRRHLAFGPFDFFKLSILVPSLKFSPPTRSAEQLLEKGVTSHFSLADIEWVLISGSQGRDFLTTPTRIG